eukprot:2271533-Pyramimonas_sp.AAC.1
MLIDLTFIKLCCTVAASRMRPLNTLAITHKPWWLAIVLTCTSGSHSVVIYTVRVVKIIAKMSAPCADTRPCGRLGLAHGCIAAHDDIRYINKLES